MLCAHFKIVFFLSLCCCKRIFRQSSVRTWNNSWRWNSQKCGEPLRLGLPGVFNFLASCQLQFIVIFLSWFIWWFLLLGFGAAVCSVLSVLFDRSKKRCWFSVCSALWCCEDRNGSFKTLYEGLETRSPPFLMFWFFCCCC